MSIVRYFINLFVLLTLYAFNCLNAYAEQNKNNVNSFSFGIVPQQSAKQIYSLWQPLVNHIKEQTSYPVQIKGSPNIPAYENSLFSGRFDIAYVNPRMLLEAHKYVGYIPIAREGGNQLKGIIVVAKDSPYQSIADLNGKKFTSPKGAFAASALPRLNLHSLGILFHNSYVETHAQGYSLTVNGVVDAAGGVHRTFNSLLPKVKNKLRILWESNGVTPHALIIHPRVSPIVRNRIIDATLGFKDTAAGKAFFNSLKINSFVAAKLTDWNDIKKLMGY